jgi:hypothetical protein
MQGFLEAISSLADTSAAQLTLRTLKSDGRVVSQVDKMPIRERDGEMIQLVRVHLPISIPLHQR